MVQQHKIAILLSTYNGAAYLQAFLDSLSNQTCQEFTLFVRDDGSNDSTIEIIEQYAVLHPETIVIDNLQNIGPKLSFGFSLKYAIQNSHIQYFVMFAYQDDIWLPEKIEMTLKQMKATEKENEEKPVLVHTDLKVVNHELELVSNSFWQYQQIDPSKDSFHRLLVQNVITGCTMMINRQLAEKSIPIHQGAIMHDWWIGLVASVLGKIVPIHEALVLYRQHIDNNVGAKKFNLRYVIKKIFAPISMDQNFMQAQSFSDSYHTILNEEHSKILSVFLTLEKATYLRKVFIVLKYRFFKIGLIRNVGFIMKL